jgi:hypothetical protein
MLVVIKFVPITFLFIIGWVFINKFVMVMQIVDFKANIY